MFRLSIGYCDGRLREDDQVSIGFADPDLTMAGVGIDMHVGDELWIEQAGADHSRVKVLDLNPNRPEASG